jgi:tyrosine-protein kinase Etk/Wzc
MSAVVNNGPLFNASPSVDEEELDLGDLLGVVIENRWLIGAITAFALLIGGYKAFTAVPIYEADGLLQVYQPRRHLDARGLRTGQRRDRDPALALGAGWRGR